MEVAMTILKDIMTTNVETVTIQDDVYKAATIMKKSDVGSVPVVDEHKHVIGMVTDRDIVIRGIAEKRSVSFTINDVMTKNVVSGKPEMTVDDAAKLMAEHQIRRLPVIENNRLVGIVALGDLAVRNIHVNEAGEALSQISEQTNYH